MYEYQSNSFPQEEVEDIIFCWFFSDEDAAQNSADCVGSKKSEYACCADQKYLVTREPYICEFVGCAQHEAVS